MKIQVEISEMCLRLFSVWLVKCSCGFNLSAIATLSSRVHFQVLRALVFCISVVVSWWKQTIEFNSNVELCFCRVSDIGIARCERTRLCVWARLICVTFQLHSIRWTCIDLLIVIGQRLCHGQQTANGSIRIAQKIKVAKKTGSRVREASSVVSVVICRAYSNDLWQIFPVDLALNESIYFEKLKLNLFADNRHLENNIFV